MPTETPPPSPPQSQVMTTPDEPRIAGAAEHQAAKAAATAEFVAGLPPQGGAPVQPMNPGTFLYLLHQAAAAAALQN